MEHLTVNRVGKPRRGILNGREHIIVPMTMIVQGVLNGSQGPLYYDEKEFGRNASDWNGVPILLGHPQGSGRSPDIINKYGVGTVFKSRVRNSKLQAEAWFDIIKLQELAPQAYSTINNGGKIELSTGFNSAFNRTPGMYQGKTYNASVTGIRPDHLAVFVDGSVGACSCNDGCGINNGKPKMTNNAGGVWRTIRGARVFIEDGKITKGPSDLVGKGEEEAKGKEESQSKQAIIDRTVPVRERRIARKPSDPNSEAAEARSKAYKEQKAREKSEGYADVAKQAGDKATAALKAGNQRLYERLSKLERLAKDHGHQTGLMAKIKEDHPDYNTLKQGIAKSEAEIAKRMKLINNLSLGVNNMAKNGKNGGAEAPKDARGELIESLVTNCGCNAEELNALDDNALAVLQHVHDFKIENAGDPEDDDDVEDGVANGEDCMEDEEEEGKPGKVVKPKTPVVNRKGNESLSVEEWLVKNNAPEELQDYIRGQQARMQQEKAELVVNIRKTDRLTLSEKQLMALPMEDKMIGNQLMLGLRSISELVAPKQTEVRVANYRGAAVTNRSRQAKPQVALGLPELDFSQQN